MKAQKNKKIDCILRFTANKHEALTDFLDQQPFPLFDLLIM